MDGLQAAKAIRALPRDDAQKVPIIALSANAFPEDVQKSRSCGMNDHLTKPLDIAKICTSLSQLIVQFQQEQADSEEKMV
jgi:CheY-like chemotaxis protein